jgi:dethiobiotin synthetase
MLEHPLAPSVAARLVGKRVSIDDILPAYNELARRHEFVIVESAGGLAVPINDESTMRDLAVRLNLPMVIVARPALGTISHTHLTAQYALAAGISIVGVIISDYPANPGLAEMTNAEEIEKLTKLPILGLIKHDQTVNTEAGELGNILEDIENNDLVDNLLKALQK